jgi:aspartate 1-decarboxylase
MFISMLKCKIHRAKVTEADLNYEGSISICPHLIEQAGLNIFEMVDVYNVNNGNRFTTYVIKGKPGEICLNGAAARLVHKGDLVIIASYAQMTPDQVKKHEPKCVFVDDMNVVKEIRNHG